MRILDFKFVLLSLLYCSDPQSWAFSTDPNREIYARQRLQRLEIPKVAMMFLTRGKMPHEGMWGSWLSAAKWLVPQSYARVEFSSTESMIPKQAVARSCRLKSSLQHYREQSLFNFYVHAPPDHTGYAADSAFWDRDIDKRVQVIWGEFSMIVAMRLLLRAALIDPLNERFMYLCEHTVPLYPPTLVYQQLMGEAKSRINACPHANRTHEDKNVFGLDRWSEEMLPHITLDLWTKSSQWLMLSRKLAKLVDNDELIIELFAKQCLPGRRCVGDEHYFPTVLAYTGVGHETSCRGNLVSTTWAGGDHPLEFSSTETKSELILALRQNSLLDQKTVRTCFDQEALRSAEASFVRSTPQWEFTQKAIEAALKYNTSYLDAETCTLFARKFRPDSAPAVQDLFEGCDSRIRINPEPHCGGIRRVKKRTRISAQVIRKKLEKGSEQIP